HIFPASHITNHGAWRSLVARSVRDRKVGGSNPLAPTHLTRKWVTNGHKARSELVSRLLGRRVQLFDRRLLGRRQLFLFELDLNLLDGTRESERRPVVGAHR